MGPAVIIGSRQKQKKTTTASLKNVFIFSENN